MATLRHVTGLASLALFGACYQPQPELYSTFPEPTEVTGPPGGEIDPAWQEGYIDENASPPEIGDGEAAVAEEASGELVGACTDEEIDTTLTPYGEWIYIEGYGEVWRPYTTVVGVDFTPYETCGTWVWTEWGWTFACEWDWGWLPFHYGRWGWFDDFWAWVPGYEWSPAWVEWRRGGGYVGWRPIPPGVRDHRTGKHGPIVRDHRTGKHGPIVRDHRTDKQGPIVRDHRDRRFGPTVRSLRRVASAKDWQWRFTAENDLGKPRIRAHLFKGLAEGLHVTKPVARPNVQAKVQPVAIASIMRPRRSFTAHAMRDQRYLSVRGSGRVEVGRVHVAPGGVRPVYERDRRASIHRPLDRASSPVTTSVYQPSWQRPRPPRTSFGGAQAAAGPVQEHAPTRQPTPTTPTFPDRHGPTRTPPGMTAPPVHAQDPITPPRPPIADTPTRTPDRYTARPPMDHPITRAPDRRTPPPTYSPPVYSPPSRASSPSTYSPPVYSPPARSSSPSSYSPPVYSPPARSSSPSTYSPPARSSSPSTYSPPARSSSPSTYSAPARSYSPPAVSAPRSHRR